MNVSIYTLASAVATLAGNTPLGTAMNDVYKALTAKGGTKWVWATMAVTQAAAALDWDTPLGVSDLVGAIANDIAKNRDQAMRWEVTNDNGTVSVGGMKIGTVSYYATGDVIIARVIGELYDALQCRPVAWANGDVFLLDGEEIAEMIESIHIVPAHGIADRMRLVDAE